MAYIYKITNNINGKIYVGKTERSIKERFQEHCNDCFRRKSEKRPLYAAFQKYGIENFSISLIEETDNPIEREIYWIKELNSFHNGYNATFGGDGTRLIDYDLVIENYQKLKSAVDVAKVMNICVDSVLDILRIKNIDIISSDQVIKQKYGKQVVALDKNTKEIVKIFNTLHEAAQWINDNEYSHSKVDTTRAHISEVCRGKRKTAYSFIWQFIEK